MEKIYSVSVILMFFFVKKKLIVQILIFFIIHQEKWRGDEEKKTFSIDKWNNNLRLQEKTLKFSFKIKLKKYSWIWNLQEKNTFPLVNVLIIILDHKIFYFL
jgi:hypothetical protein